VNTLSYKKSEISNLIPILSLKQIENLLSLIKNLSSNKGNSKRISLSGIWSEASINLLQFEQGLEELHLDISRKIINGNFWL
jgi:hypothetical protein